MSSYTLMLLPGTHIYKYIYSRVQCNEQCDTYKTNSLGIRQSPVFAQNTLERQQHNIHLQYCSIMVVLHMRITALLCVSFFNSCEFTSIVSTKQAHHYISLHVP